MGRFTQDPLLATARVFIVGIQALFAISAVICAVAIPFVLLGNGRLVMAITEKTAKAPDNTTLQLMALTLVIGIVFFAVLFGFLLMMRRIVETVAEGDPFTPINAWRLTRMAWLTVATQVIVVIMGGLIGLMMSRHEGNGDTEASFSFDLSGIVLILTLFVLARVFRIGAAMREDLEGTV